MAVDWSLRLYSISYTFACELRHERILLYKEVSHDRYKSSPLTKECHRELLVIIESKKRCSL